MINVSAYNTIKEFISLDKIPKKINLANTPTPIEKITFEGKSFLIKRDDLTGVELSGNKVRKLEYLLYQAVKEKSDIVFTSGGEQSNHARATAIAAAKLGMKSKLFLWGKDSSIPDGNLFIDKFIGSEIRFLTKKENERVNEVMFNERKELLKKGKRVFVIPEGGSTVLGIWGYISALLEIFAQIDLKKIDGVLTAAGSGGTAAGLLVGSALLKEAGNSRIKIFAVNVLYSKEEIKKKILNLAEGCLLEISHKAVSASGRKLSFDIPEDNLEIIDGYSKEGYKNITEDKLKLINHFARSTGIILDPAYTGKAFKAYYENFLSKDRGMRVIFLHTGGLFGIFGKRTKYLKVC